MNSVCPERDRATCFKTCSADMSSLGQECRATKRAEYDCIATEVLNGQSCSYGILIASKLCGGTDGWPDPCPDQACEVSISGDATGCHAVTACGFHQADLLCLETGGPPLCSCTIDGKKVADFAAGFNSAKAACNSDDLRLLCVDYLL